MTVVVLMGSGIVLMAVMLTVTALVMVAAILAMLIGADICRWRPNGKHHSSMSRRDDPSQSLSYSWHRSGI